MADLIIDAQGLRKVFGSKLAVADLTLQVRRGEVFGFLGPNGAGKTTSIKMLLSLISPTSGTAMLLGRPLGDRTARARIGFLPEHFRFHEWLEAGEFLHFHGRLYGMRSEQLEEAEDARDAAPAVDDEDRAERPQGDVRDAPDHDRGAGDEDLEGHALLPLDRRGRLARHVEHDAVHAAHLVRDAARDAREERVRQARPVRGHAVLARHRTERDHAVVGARGLSQPLVVVDAQVAREKDDGRPHVISPPAAMRTRDQPLRPGRPAALAGRRRAGRRSAQPCHR